MEKEQLNGSESFSTQTQVNTELELGEWLDQLCIYYMSCGVSCQEFWHGDYTYFHYYERAEKAKQRKQNYFAWIQGAYVQSALLSTVGNMFREKGSSPISYAKEPFALESDEAENQKIRQQQKKEQDMKKRMLAFADVFNAQKEMQTREGK